MSNKYNFKDSEHKRQQYRLDNNIYKFDKDNLDKQVFSIDTPPPTISGKLHIGHIFSFTQAEMIGRYKRMKGYNVFYPMGYDDNGIPTEILVEKETGINIKDTPRKDFVQKCLELDQKYKEIFSELWIKQGFSIDRSRTYTTIQPEVQQIAQKQFIELYNKGEIVAKEFPALRCTKNQTTIAQAETEEQEFEEFFNDIRFDLEDGGHIVIATTRPELIPSCLALIVNTEDKRYSHLIGKKAITPFGLKVDIIGDEKVKMDKGTGAVMCCSYGDEVDVFWVNKYQLKPKIILDRYGKLFDTDIEEINGLKVAEARKLIIQILDQKGFLIKSTPIVQSKSISERGKVPVEIIPVHQRFVKILDKKDILLAQNDKMNRYPEFMKKRSNDWIQNLHRDRNISRARKFGIPIPVRYSKKTGEIILPTQEQLSVGPIDPTSMMPGSLPPNHTYDDILPEEMVLDTWFTSGLTPLINQKFLERDGGKHNLLPFDLRPQAHDIIRTWLLYTTLHSYIRDGEIPFQNIMISGFVMAGRGEKISKSKGNAKFEPMSLLDQRGADAVRYRALGGQLGKDILFEENEVKAGQKLVTKLRNAFQFVKMQLGDLNIQQNAPDYTKITQTDKRIILRLRDTTKKMTDYLDRFEYGLAKIAFEEFFWADFCDNYLEMIKMRVYKPEMFDDGEIKKLSAQWTLCDVFYNIIKLISPFFPHITEEIYQDYFVSIFGHKSIHIADYPEYKYFDFLDGQDIILKQIDGIKTIIEEVRKYKTENQMSLGADISQLDIFGKQEILEDIKLYQDDIKGVTKATKINLIPQDEQDILIKITK